jgi:hypothetical protein
MSSPQVQMLQPIEPIPTSTNPYDIWWSPQVGIGPQLAPPSPSGWSSGLVSNADVAQDAGLAIALENAQTGQNFKLVEVTTAEQQLGSIGGIYDQLTLVVTNGDSEGVVKATVYSNINLAPGGNSTQFLAGWENVSEPLTSANKLISAMGAFDSPPTVSMSPNLSAGSASVPLVLTALHSN